MQRKEHLYAGYSDMPELPIPARYARRALLRAAVFDTRGQEAAPASASTVLTGVLTDVSRHSIAVQGAAGEQVLSLAPGTVVWLGTRVSPSVLRVGDPVVIRHQPRRAGAGAQAPVVAERIWARIGRVAGTIVAAGGRAEPEFLVDVGRQGGPAERVVVAGASLRQIQVRFPRLSPGYLIDVIGTRHRGYLLAVAPATAQPPYRAGHPPAPPRSGGRLADPISGTAVWHEPVGEPAGLLGLAYPELDPDTDDRAADPAWVVADHGCVRLPYLSLGSTVRVRNECTHRTAVLPVTSRGVIARQFCDRCLACGTSPKGRLADLTVAAFVELGGNLEDNCFNATLALAN
jgi:hypothetical protein